jgi:hypothetical protein
LSLSVPLIFLCSFEFLRLFVSSPLSLPSLGVIRSDQAKKRNDQQSAGTDENREPDSNVTLQSALHLEKQPSPRTSTEEGMQIDESEEQE